MARKLEHFAKLERVERAHQFGEPGGVAVTIRLELNLADRFLNGVEQRTLIQALKQLYNCPTILGGALHGPEDLALDKLIAQNGPRPKSYRHGGHGQLQWWRALHQAAEGSAALRGRWWNWRALRNYVDARERREQREYAAFQARVSEQLQAREPALEAASLKAAEDCERLFQEWKRCSQRPARKRKHI
jgi:hypothetical protein